MRVLEKNNRAKAVDGRILMPWRIS